MKRLFKILGITLATLLGIVVVAAGVAVYVVFTPRQLTPLVDKLARSYITCDYQLEDLELTFFSTFPEFGLKADRLVVINPTEGAPSDTLLSTGKVVARIQLMQLLKEGCINIREVGIQHLQANAFIAADGRTNFDVLNLPEDTTVSDTTAAFIRSVQIEDVRLNIDADRLTLLDLCDSIRASLYDVDLSLRAQAQNDTTFGGSLALAFPRLSAEYKGVQYAKDADIRLSLPFDANVQWADSALGVAAAALTMKEAQLAVNEFKLGLNGWARILPEIQLNLDAQTNAWHIRPLLALVPAELFTLPDSIDVDGRVGLNAHIEGQYNDSTWPLIQAYATLGDATATYAPLPYTVENLNAEAGLWLNLNTRRANAKVHRLVADVKESHLEASGDVTDILGDMLLDLQLNALVHLPDIAYFLPKGTTAKGKAEGDVQLKIALDDLTNKRLTAGNIAGNIRLSGLQATMDSMSVSAPKARLRFTIPNATQPDKTNYQAVARRRNLDLLSGTIALPSGLTFSMIDGSKAQLEQTDLIIQLGDLLNRETICADLDIVSSSIQGEMTLRDSLGRTTPAKAVLTKPNLCGYVEYNPHDSTAVPTLACDFALDRLQATYDTITVDATAPNGSASMQAGYTDKTQPRVQVQLRLNHLRTEMGRLLALQTHHLDVELNAQHSQNKDNILLEWSPRLNFDIRQVIVTPDPTLFKETVRIPEIKFAYSNQVFDIDTARVELGHSNFTLAGRIYNMGPWLENTGLLKGKLRFHSTMADIDELMAFTSGIGSTEADSAAVESEDIDQEAHPYMVPRGVDITLDTRIEQAVALGENVRNLKGRLYIQDGLLVLEQMGFICKAARLELTAMYKTPRSNHLYAGLDYHMYDINVAELVDLIPQVDTLLPMLRAFKGGAEFHLAAETYLNGRYQIKPSTTRGACSIQGQNLTVLDGETFSKIAKLLTFKSSTENKIDSISAEITLFRKEVDIYPFLITMDKYMAAVGGQYHPYDHQTAHNYHISLLNPLYLGVDVLTDKKNPDKLNIKLAKCRYAKDFKPVFTKVVDTQAMDIRRLIREALTKNAE